MGILKSKIVVVPLGEVDFMLVNRLAADLGPVFNRSIDILKGMKMPKEAYNVIRNQYYASVLISKLERLKSNSKEKVLGVCEEDLYIPDERNILGYADQLAGTSVVSLYEFRQEFYGLPEDEKKVYPRLFKESIHQVGHLYDLTDCRNARCVNYFSKMMPDIDSKGEKFCDICQRQLAGTI